jgi:hypothetical protein
VGLRDGRELSGFELFDLELDYHQFRPGLLQPVRLIRALQVLLMKGPAFVIRLFEGKTFDD